MAWWASCRAQGERLREDRGATMRIALDGGASAEELAQLARFIQGRVQSEFGLILQPEPVLVGIEL